MANSISYVAAPPQSPNFSGTPKPLSKIAESNGAINRDWWRYLNSFSTQPQQEGAVVLGASPTQFKATVNGTFLISGGTISGLSITRQGSYALPNTTALIPMSIGDIIGIIYSVAPVCTFLPR